MKIGDHFDDLTDRAARATTNRFTRRSLVGRVGRGALVLGAGATVFGGLDTQQGLAAFSPLCGGVCNGACPSGSTFDGGCWWGCDTASAMCCSGNKQRKICDCRITCAGFGNPPCSQCGRLPAVYFIGPCIGDCCTRCRRVTACSATVC